MKMYKNDAGQYCANKKHGGCTALLVKNNLDVLMKVKTIGIFPRVGELQSQLQLNLHCCRYRCKQAFYHSTYTNNVCCLKCVGTFLRPFRKGFSKVVQTHDVLNVNIFCQCGKLNA